MKPRNAFMLLLASFIWGTAFVAQSVGMDYIGPFTFNGIRSLIGAAVLVPFIGLFGYLRKREAQKKGSEVPPENRRDLLTAGITCGVLLFIATSLQQIGLQYTSVGKSGFITAFYIVFVPVLGIFLHKKTGWRVWTAVGIALVGLYLLCITEEFTIGIGDILTIFCALTFSCHILVVDHFSPKVDGIKMSCLQFLVCGLLSMPFMFLFETPRPDAIFAGIGPLLYAGALSCGLAYTLQIVGQKNMNPAIASLLMSPESCFSVLAGWVVLGERLTGREYLGCALMFAAIILAQLPDRKEKT